MKICLLSLAVLQVLQVHAVLIATTNGNVHVQVPPPEQVVPNSVLPHPPQDDSDSEADDDDDNDGDDDTRKNNCSHLEDDLKDIKEELAANLHQQAELRQIIKHLGDKAMSDQEIKSAASLVANETESVAMSQMLSSMWKEMRMFELPSYSDYVKKELHNLTIEETSLEDELTAKVGEIENCTYPKNEETKDEPAAHLSEEHIRKELSEENIREEHEAHQSAWSKWDVWSMSRDQRQAVFEGSIVYLIGGILIGYLYKQAAASYPIIFQPELHTPKNSPDSDDFSFHLFDCFSAPKLCILGCCCPCLMWSDTLERRGLLSYWKAFMAFFGLMWLHVYTRGISSVVLIILGVVYRQKLRGSYQIANGTAVTVAMDALAWCFCQPCAIIQEARQDGVVYTGSAIGRCFTPESPYSP